MHDRFSRHFDDGEYFEVGGSGGRVGRRLTADDESEWNSDDKQVAEGLQGSVLSYTACAARLIEYGVSATP